MSPVDFHRLRQGQQLATCINQRPRETRNIQIAGHQTSVLKPWPCEAQVKKVAALNDSSVIGCKTNSEGADCEFAYHGYSAHLQSYNIVPELSDTS